MRKTAILLSIAATLHFSALAQTTVTLDSTVLTVRTVIQGTNSSNGIDIPWEIQWGPDDYIWMTERSGRVSRLNPETGDRTTILDLSSTIYDQSESGLLGLALHPDFSNNPYVYLAYTYSSGSVKERIVRYTYDEGTGQLVSPLILLDNILGNSTHVGCRLLILPDLTMLASTGDVHQENLVSQDVNQLNGKILRMNLDGSIPSDNPFGPTSYAYSIGHRNAQGLVLAPNGKIYSSEHGPSTNDEFNIIVAGGNYGWPDVEGFCNQSSEITACNSMTDYQDPIAIWYENSTIAPSDLIWYDSPAIPEWQGRMLMTVLKAEHLKVITVDDVDGTTVTSQQILFNDAHAADHSSFSQGQFNRLRDICAAPDGRVFIATSGSSWSDSNPFSHSIIELKNENYDPLGIENGLQMPETAILPNPNHGSMTVNFPSRWEGSPFTIMDNAGRIVHQGTINAQKMPLDLRILAPGLYIIRSVKENLYSTKRFVING